MSNEGALIPSGTTYPTTTRLAERRDRRKRAEAELVRADVQQASLEAEGTNIIFAVDATGSRSGYWDQTKIVQEQMFYAAHEAGTKLSAQLVVFYGDKPLDVSPWSATPQNLCNAMSQITCESGQTEIGEVFQHVLRETCNRKINALIFIGDSCEEDQSYLVSLAQQIKEKGVPFFLFDDGARSTCRHAQTDSIFAAIKNAANGTYATFSIKNLAVLEDYLRTAVVVATRNPLAIERLKLKPHTPEGRQMLEQSLKALPPAKNF